MNKPNHQMTQGTNNRLKELFEKYVDRTISQEEYAELFMYIRNPESKQDILDFMDQHNKEVQSDALVHEIDWDAMYTNITSQHTKERRRFISWKYAAAAVLFLVAGFALYHHGTVKVDKKNILTYKNDIRPAGNKAILTLADGSQIALTDGIRGKLATQGAINIERDTEGRVVYKVDNNNANDGQKMNTLSTPEGGTFSVVLSDGSKVWLNAVSSIKFPAAFDANERRVEIKGEAYFEIQKDAKRPFYVKNGNAEIKVLGTHFNVMSYPNEYRSELTLLEGSVQFSKDGHSELLKPGRQIQYVESSTGTKQVDANIEEVMAWKNNLFVFNNTNFDEIMKDLMRWYNIKIKYEGDKPDISFTGVIPRNSNVSKVLKTLELTGDVIFGIENNVVTCQKR